MIVIRNRYIQVLRWTALTTAVRMIIGIENVPVTVAVPSQPVTSLIGSIN